MTFHAPPTGRLMTAQEVAAETGLRPDLVTRFVPHVASPSGPLYNAQNLAAAHRVKQLTDVGTPAEAIEGAVRDIANSGGMDAAANQVQSTGPRRGKILAAAGAAAAVALIIGGVIGGLIGYNNRGTAPSAAPVTVTAQAPVTGLTPTLADKRLSRASWNLRWRSLT